VLPQPGGSTCIRPLKPPVGEREKERREKGGRETHSRAFLIVLDHMVVRDFEVPSPTDDYYQQRKGQVEGVKH
jgi:hypothetical protein